MIIILTLDRYPEASYQ